MTQTITPIDVSELHPEFQNDANLQQVNPISVKDAFGIPSTSKEAPTTPVVDDYGRQVETPEPSLTEDDFLKAKYGDNFSDDHWFGGDSVSDTWNTALLGKYNTNEGRKRKFKEWYPEGDIRFTTAGGNDVAVARRNSTEPYRKISGWVTTPGDILVSGPTIAGAAAAPFTAGASAVLGIAGETMATMFGSAGEDMLAKSLWEPERTGSTALKAGGEGAVQALMSTALRGGIIGITVGNLVDQAKMTPGAKKALQAVQDEGLIPLTKGQFYSGDPSVRAIYEQYSTQNAKGLEEALKAYESLGQDGLLEYVKKNGFRGMRKDVLGKLTEKQAGKIDSLVSGMRTGGVSWKEGSEELKKTLDTYFELAKNQETVLYNDAKSLANSSNVEFDLEPVQELAREIRRGIKTRAIPTVTSTGTSTSTTASTRTINPPSSKLEGLLKEIEDTDPVVSQLARSGKPVESSMDQMIQLRKRIGDALAEAKEGTTEYSNLSRLYGKYTEMMHNPTNGDPGFVDLWKRANAYSSLNHSLKQLDPIVSLGKADPFKYAQYARNLTKPENADSLLLLEGLVKKTDPVSWDKFRASFVGFITDDPSKGLRTLDGFKDAYREDALRALMSPNEEKVVRDYLTQRQALENSPLWKAKEAEDTNLAIKGLDLATAGNLDDLATLVKVSGGKSSSTVKGMKAAIVKSWFDSAHIPEQHVDTGSIIDRDKFIGIVEKWKKDGRLDVIFTPSDWKWLENMENYAIQLPSTPVTARGSSTGASMQGAAQAGLEQRIGPEVAEAVLSGNEAKAAKKVWNVFKLPLGREFTGRVMGLNTRITSEPKGFNSTTQHTLKLMRELAKRAPVLGLEAMDSIHYNDDNVYPSP